MKPRPVTELVAEIPSQAWKRCTVAEGSQGPRICEYAELTVWFSEEGLPTNQPERLLFKRSVSPDPELQFQRSHAPQTIPLKKVAEIGGCRWCVEQDFPCSKGECGWDEYETRGWIGWHHHTALSLLALWFLMLQKVRLGGKTPPTHRPGSPNGAPQSARPQALGRTRNPPLVQPSPKPQRRSQTLPRRTKIPLTKTPTRQIIQTGAVVLRHDARRIPSMGPPFVRAENRPLSSWRAGNTLHASFRAV